MATAAAPRDVRPTVVVSTRPATCPAVTTINAAISRLEVAFRNEPDSDKRGALIDAFNATYPTACLTPAMTLRLLPLTRTLRVQSAAELASFPSNPLAAIAQVLGLLTKPATWIRAGELIGGGVLVYMGLRTVLRELGGPALPTVAAAAARLKP